MAGSSGSTNRRYPRHGRCARGFRTWWATRSEHAHLSIVQTRALLAVALLLAACDGDDGEEPAIDDAPIRDAVDQHLGDGMATGYSVAIWRDGEVIYAEGFGDKDAEGSPVTADTLFQIGSDTTKVAAIALLQQVQAGVVQLDDTVGTIIPDLVLTRSPTQLETLTLDVLISHRSGLFDYTPWTEAPGDDQLEAIMRGRFAQNEYAMMPPGIAWNYANPAFSLAGFVTEYVDGRAWSDLVAETVFAPLGMVHTYARRDDMLASEGDIADGHGMLLPDGYDSFSLFDQALTST